MCLAVPGKITKIENGFATVDYGEVSTKACVRVVPDAKPGDTVLVHAGFVIQVLDEKASSEYEELSAEFPGLI